MKVKLLMDLQAYSTNTAIMLPVVIMMYLGWDVPPMPWICGIATGIWIGMAHNVIWGLLAWKQTNSGGTEDIPKE